MVSATVHSRGGRVKTGSSAAGEVGVDVACVAQPNVACRPERRTTAAECSNRAAATFSGDVIVASPASVVMARPLSFERRVSLVGVASCDRGCWCEMLTVSCCRPVGRRDREFVGYGARDELVVRGVAA